MRNLLWSIVLLLFAGSVAGQAKEQEIETGELPTISKKTQDMDVHPGYFDLFWDEKSGKVLLKVDRLDEPVLYVTSLPNGVGSNDIGLDRGQLSRSSLVVFRRMGPSVLLFEPNQDYRALSDNSAEVQAVEQAFAQSVLAGFEVVAADPDAVLVDVTEHLLSDAHGVIDSLTLLEQGEYQLDPKRSAAAPDGLKSFPENTVMEAWITFAGDKPGPMISSVTPTPKALTVRMRHEFVKLPTAGFEMRPYHPRSGFF
jgi:hypothetical protein